MMIFETEKGKTIVAVFGQDVTKEQAIKKANKHFKVKTDRLEVRKGYIYNGGLFWEEQDTNVFGVIAWAVYKKGLEV